MKEDKQRFYYCKHCGNMIGFIQQSGVPLSAVVKNGRTCGEYHGCVGGKTCPCYYC